MNGYEVQASDGAIGHVCDFMIDYESWAIRKIVVRMSHRFSSKEVRLPTRAVDWINHQESKLILNLTTAAVQQIPEHRLGP